MIWIRPILAAFLGAACSLVGGGAGMIRGAVLFVLLTSGIRLVHRCRLVWAALLCGSVAGGVAAAVFCRMPAGAVEIGNVQVIAVCLLYGIGFYWAEYLSQTSHFPGAILATLVVAVAAQLVRYGLWQYGADQMEAGVLTLYFAVMNAVGVAAAWCVTMLCRNRDGMLLEKKKRE